MGIGWCACGRACARPALHRRGIAGSPEPNGDAHSRSFAGLAFGFALGPVDGQEVPQTRSPYRRSMCYARGPAAGGP